MNLINTYKINTQKFLSFLYANNQKSERGIKETTPFITATKRVKKKTKDLYTYILRKNFKATINH